MDENKWTLIHKYNAQALLGQWDFLRCPTCQERVTLRIGPDDDPVLWCLLEDVTIVPGTQFWADIRSSLS